jgi:hypothetical protein
LIVPKENIINNKIELGNQDRETDWQGNTEDLPVGNLYL